MVRRSWNEAQITRERILDAAEWCFRMRGVSATSMASIATHAGYTRGAIYWHFRERIDILRSVFERGRPDLAARLDSATRHSAPILPSLRNCLRQCLLDIEKNEHVRNVAEILSYRCDFSGEQEQILESWNRELVSVRISLDEILKCAWQSGELRDGIDHAAGAALICFVLLGGVRFYLIRPRSPALQRDTMAALDFVFDHIMAKTGERKVG